MAPTRFQIRPATVADIDFMWEMLYESAFTTEENRAAWRRNPVKPPELRKYLDGWGRDGDAGVVAEEPQNGQYAGAAWYRLFARSERGDGILALDGVPELAIAVEPRYRRHGVGGLLLRALAKRSAKDSFKRLILSVDPANAPALRLYERTGFTVLDTSDPARGTSLIMQLDL